MRKITIYQQGSSNVEILDDSDLPLDEYCQELSRLFKMTNVSILKTSQSTFIGRPSQLTGIVVEDAQTEETQSIPKQEGIEIPPEPEKIQEDIITDVD